MLWSPLCPSRRMSRSLLSEPSGCADILTSASSSIYSYRIIFRTRRAHDTLTCGKSASGREILRSRGRPTSRPGGAPGGAAPVQRASQTRWIGRRASRAGVATPFVRRVTGASSAPARGLASPWRLPALHSRSERKMGTGGPAPAKQQGRRSVGFVMVAVLLSQ